MARWMAHQMLVSPLALPGCSGRLCEEGLCAQTVLCFITKWQRWDLSSITEQGQMEDWHPLSL